MSRFLIRARLPKADHRRPAGAQVFLHRARNGTLHLRDDARDASLVGLGRIRDAEWQKALAERFPGFEWDGVEVEE